MAWLLLVFLTALAGLAAVAVALRTKPSGRAELALTTCILWNAIIGCPIYALGYTGHLTAPALATVSGLFFVGVLGAAIGRGSPARSGREIAAAVVALVALPFDAIGRATRGRSLVVLALVLTAFLIPYSAFCAYFTPSWRQWDSLWYHETIIGYTLQTHSFAAVPNLPDGLQKANGYPRFCEMIQLWFVAFTGRRLIELPNSLIAPGFMYATYLIARRYTRDEISCMAWAAVAMIMPCASEFLQSTYIDIHVALFVLAGTYYATKPVYRLADAWLAAICITLAIGSKYLALPPTGIILFIALLRLIHNHRPSLASVGTAVGGGLLIVAMSAGVFWRNWKAFKNPLWPDLDYAGHGLHFAGVSFGGQNPFNMNMKVPDLIDALLSIPYSVAGLGSKGQLFEYGIAVIWVVFPLSVVSLLAASYLWGRHLVGRVAGIESWWAPEAVNPLLVALPVAAQIWLSPALWSARYHIANVGALAAIVAFLGGRPRWHSFGAGAAVTAAVASLIVTHWMKPRWVWLPSELQSLAAIPYPEREVTPASTVSKVLDKSSGSAMTREVGLAREALKPGEIFSFDDTAFPALLWNNSFTNKILYLPAGPSYLARLNASGARLALVSIAPGPAEVEAACKGPNPTWKDLGWFNVENWAHVYVRLTP